MRIAPLKSSFMVISILGFIISAVVVYDLPYKSAPGFAFAFCLVFTLMFIASLVSMTYGPVD